VLDAAQHWEEIPLPPSGPVVDALVGSLERAMGGIRIDAGPQVLLVTEKARPWVAAALLLTQPQLHVLSHGEMRMPTLLWRRCRLWKTSRYSKIALAMGNALHRYTGPITGPGQRSDQRFRWSDPRCWARQGLNR
jgi:hypothetical protein